MSEFVEETPVKAQTLPAYSEANVDFNDLPVPKAASLRSTYYGLDSQALIEKVKTQLSNAKDWTEDNKGLVIGSAVGVGVGLGIGLLTLAAKKGAAKGRRTGRGKREARLERRALEAEARGEFDQDFDEEEFLEFLESLGDLDLVDFEE